MTSMEMWAVVDDNDEVIQLVGVDFGTLSQIRDDGEWREISVKEMDASDDLTVVTMSEEFVPVYDEAVRSGKTLKLGEIESYELETT